MLHSLLHDAGVFVVGMSRANELKSSVAAIGYMKVSAQKAKPEVQGAWDFGIRLFQMKHLFEMLVSLVIWTYVATSADQETVVLNCLAVDYISRIEDEIVGAYSSETAQRLADELPAHEGKEVWESVRCGQELHDGFLIFALLGFTFVAVICGAQLRQKQDDW